MALNIQDSRMWMKVSTVNGEAPTIPVSTDHTDGSWVPTDVYEREFFVNSADRKVYMRMNNSIRQLGVLPQGIATGDVLYINASGTISRLPIGTSGFVLTSDGTVPTWNAVSGATSSAGVTWSVFNYYTGTTNDILAVLQAVSGATSSGSGTPAAPLNAVQWNGNGSFSGVTYHTFEFPSFNYTNSSGSTIASSQFSAIVGGNNHALTNASNVVMLGGSGETLNNVSNVAWVPELYAKNGATITDTAAAFYFGDKNTNGTWRIVRSGNNLDFQRRESGVWVSKSLMRP